MDYLVRDSRLQQPPQLDCTSTLPLDDDDANLLQTALFASWFTFGFPAILWLFMNKGRYLSSPTKILLTVVNVIIIGIACALVCVSRFSRMFNH